MYNKNYNDKERRHKMKIKEFRKKYELTQGDVALKVGVSLSTVQTWERGYGKPTEERLERLTDLFSTYKEIYKEV